MAKSKDYDAIVIGSGPNGLAAAITLQQHGLSVLIIEGSDTAGGGLRTKELTLPGFYHDVCSAIHPMAVSSPFFSSLPLNKFGLQYITPPVCVAHPFDDGNAAVLTNSLEETANLLGADKNAYEGLIGPVINNWPFIGNDVMGPLHFPEYPSKMIAFGLKALTSAEHLARRFKTKEARGLWAGIAGHSVQPLSNHGTSAIGLVLMSAAHRGGWPIARGGSKTIAESLLAYFISLGGQVQLGTYVKTLQELPSSRAVLFDTTPRQLLQIAGHRFSSIYKWQLNRYRYGPGVFKMDFALDGPVPFTADQCNAAGTVHLGNTLEEIAEGERLIWKGIHPENPFVLLAQQSIFDASRAPEGKHTAWAYCHVPNGSTKNMSVIIEKQIERFAPGFRDRILARSSMNTEQIEEYNPNYIGGDIGGGAIDLSQLFTRPALRSSPYRTSAKGLYICSSSTPPGGGVHGLCGYHAARRVLKDLFAGSIKDRF